MADIGDWSALAQPDPEFEKVVKEVGKPDLGKFPDVASMRKFFEEMKAKASASMAPVPGVKEHDQQVTMRDGKTIACRVYQPENPAAGGSPLAVVFHGGGWCIGGLVNEEPICRLMAGKLGMVAVNVDYRLAPEHKYPTAVHDSYDATQWAVDKASSWGANPAKGFILTGTSAGAGLVAVLSHLWRDEKKNPPLTGSHLMIPLVCNRNDFPEQYRKDYKSFDELADAPILTRSALDLFFDNYIPDHAQRSEPTFSPLLFKTGHKGLPPTYFQLCGWDPLRDEGLIYERVLREESGVKTRIDVYPGLPHGFHSSFPQLQATRKFVDDSMKGVQWLLKQ